MQKNEIVARLMACDPKKLNGRRLGAVADQILARTAGDEAEIARELARLGLCATRSIHHGLATTNR